MKITYLLIVSFLFITPEIKSDQLYDTCVIEQVTNFANRSKFVKARDIIRNCACFSNRYKQGLSVFDCPTMKTIGEREASDYFVW